MTTKSRLKRIKKQIKPDQKIIVIWEDMHNPGVFYTTSRPEDGKRITQADIDELENKEPDAVLIRVVYDRTAEKNLKS